MTNEPLEELRFQIVAWRKTKKHGDRLPEDTWARIIVLCRSCSASMVAKRLGLDYYQLKQRIAADENSHASLTCSRIINIAQAPSDAVLPPRSGALCEIDFPSGMTARFFDDCETLRLLMMPGTR